MSQVPTNSESYLGPITDTSRWENFQHRADDIFICTPPKCGTTWTQAICAMLVFGTTDHGKQVSSISPWIDAAFAPIDAYLAEIDQQAHRRFIKTHTPFDGIPYYPECTYLVIFRDPRDVYLSGINHRDNMTDEELANSVFPSGANAYSDWLHAVREPGTWDLQSVDSLAHFYRSYWPYRDLPNVHIHHYTDMKNELQRAIGSMALALGVSYSDAQLAEFAEAASFESMKSKADQFAPESGTGMWKKEMDFFANGSSRQWQDQLSADDLAAFDKRIGELLDEDDVNWMLNGYGR